MSQVATHETRRRCVSCRNTRDKRELLRFSIVDDTVLFDARQRIPGRGVNVCPRRACILTAAKGAFRRGAKRKLKAIDADALINTQIVPALERLSKEFVALGRKSGTLVCGSEKVKRAARDGDLVAYMVASDASEGTAEKYRRNAERKGIPFYHELERSYFESVTGLQGVTVMGWRKGSVFNRFEQIAWQLKCLGALPSEKES